MVRVFRSFLQEKTMSYFKKLFFLFVVVLFTTPALSIADTSIEWEGDVARGYEKVAPKWSITLPKDFPKDCLEEAIKQPGMETVCRPVVEDDILFPSYFYLKTFSIYFNEHPEKRYTIQWGDAGPMVTETVEALSIPTERQSLLLSSIMLYAVLVAIVITSLLSAGNWTRLIIQYGVIFCTIGIIAVSRSIGGSGATLLALCFIGGFLGILIGEKLGTYFSCFSTGYAVMMSGLSTGLLTKNGWKEGGMNGYLISLVLACVAGLILRAILVAIKKERDSRLI